MTLFFFLCFTAWPMGLSVWGAEIAILISSDIPAYTKATEGIRQVLPRQATIHEYQMRGNTQKGHEMATSIRALNPNIVLVVGLKAALIAKVEIMDQPVVFCMVTSPSQYGLPTGNMTGVLMDSTPLDQLTSMKTVLPGLRRLAMLYHADHAGIFVEEAQRQAASLKIDLQAISIHSKAEVPPVLRQLVHDADALWLIRDQTVVNPESLEFIMDTAIDHNLPVFGFSTGLMRYGALATFSADYLVIGHSAGRLAKDILRGRYSLSSLPQPFFPGPTQLALNMNAAKFLGITLPDQAMQLASELFGGPGAFAKAKQAETSDPFLVE